MLPIVLYLHTVIVIQHSGFASYFQVPRQISVSSVLHNTKLQWFNVILIQMKDLILEKPGKHENRYIVGNDSLLLSPGLLRTSHILFLTFCNNAEIFQLAMSFLPISSYWVRDEARKRYGESYAKKKYSLSLNSWKLIKFIGGNQTIKQIPPKPTWSGYIQHGLLQVRDCRRSSV